MDFRSPHLTRRKCVTEESKHKLAIEGNDSPRGAGEEAKSGNGDRKPSAWNRSQVLRLLTRAQHRRMPCLFCGHIRRAGRRARSLRALLSRNVRRQIRHLPDLQPALQEFQHGGVS